MFPRHLMQEIPGLEDKMTALANATTPESFFSILGVDTSSYTSNTVTGSGPQVITSSAHRMHVRQAGCEPEWRTINLSEYTHTNLDVDTVAFPRCIRVPRCGGCCGPSDVLQCLPTKITTRDVSRVLQRLTPGSKDSKNTIEEMVQVEYHEACACQCKIQEKDCDLNTHVYDKDLCMCRCPETSDQEKCMSHPAKYWNQAVCACVCKQTRRCSTGLAFSHESCSCQMLPS